MDANLPRWIFQSIASHFQSVAADLSLPFLVEGIDERSDETMHSDHVELRVTGPTVKEISRDYYDTDTVINFLFTKAMDPVDTNAYDLIQWTGAFASEMLLPIPIYKKGSGPDDDGSFISCLRIAKGRKEAARIYHFGQLDKDTPVRQSEVDAVFSMDYYSSLVINPPQAVFSVLALTSGVVGEKTRPATTTMNLTDVTVAAKLLNRSAVTTMNLNSDVVEVRTYQATTMMNLTSSAIAARAYSIATTMNLTDVAAVESRLLSRPATTTMNLTDVTVGVQHLVRSAATTMNLTDVTVGVQHLVRSAATTMNLNSDVGSIIPTIHTPNLTTSMSLVSNVWDGNFRSTWNTSDTSAGSSNTVQVALPLVSDGTYNFVVDWGDSTSNTITAYGDAAKVHTYNSSGNYTIVITGEIQGWEFADAGDKLKISVVSNWGDLNLANPIGVAEDNFQGCTNLTINATDALYLMDTTSLNGTFNNCDSIVSGGVGMATWDTSSITSLTGVFYECNAFNANIGSWNTANVSNMLQVFNNCAAFNQDIGSWNTTNTNNMTSMFFGCTAFDQDIGSWNTANVTNMGSMFRDCTTFNQNIDSWNTAKVTNMSNMFQGGDVFNRDIGSWNTANVSNMGSTLRGCTAFDQDISSWNTSNVTNMSNMFKDCTAFNQDLSGWDITSLTNATSMFDGATLSTTNYSALLIGWEAGTHQSSVTFHGGNSTYNAAGKVARDALTADSWAITDGGIVTFRSTWNTSATSSGSSNTVQVALPLVSGGTYNFNVDWGDSTDDTITAYGDAAKLHTYNSSGNYTINITGEIQGWQFDDGGDKLKISNIANWGTLDFTSVTGAFFGCGNLTINASDSPQLVSGFNNFTSFFNACDSLIGSGNGFANWDMSSTTNMSQMFHDCDVFNSPHIGNWNTANVNNMLRLFRSCVNFNQDISSWNTANTTNMSGTLQTCNSFNQDISSWNTANVTNMASTFYQCKAFNQDIGIWNTANTTNMSFMFHDMLAFDQDIGSWNTANVTSMSYMFWKSSAFDQDLSGWDITSLSDATWMFNLSGLGDANYDLLLIGWGAQAVQSGVPFHGGSAQYTSAGEVGRDALLAEGWTITDGGGPI